MVKAAQRTSTRRGVGTAIGGELLGRGFGLMELHRIHAPCDPRDVASGRRWSGSGSRPGVRELAGPWTAARESELTERRGHGRLRAAGAGPDHQLVFVDRVLVILVVLRWALSHGVLAAPFGVSPSTSEEQGRERWPGAIRPGRVHDVTTVRTEGTAEEELTARARPIGCRGHE